MNWNLKVHFNLDVRSNYIYLNCLTPHMLNMITRINSLFLSISSTQNILSKFPQAVRKVWDIFWRKILEYLKKKIKNRIGLLSCNSVSLNCFCKQIYTVCHLKTKSNTSKGILIFLFHYRRIRLCAISNTR